MNYLLTGEESERLLFRNLESSDFSTWLTFMKDPLWSAYWSMTRLTPEEHCKQWFDKIFQRYAHHLGGMNVLIHKETGEFVGQAGLLIQTVDDIQELEVGYSIMPAHRGKGYAPEAAKKCIDYAFANKLSHSLISIIHQQNTESEKVALKNKLRLDKKTIYDSNPVNIYRIERTISTFL